MSDWSTIKKGFVEWLKKQDSDFKETDKDFAPIKYKEQFKLYIEKHDNDDNVNMDSFTKSVVENTNNKTLFDNMFDDYISNLETSDVVFKAIDGLADGKKDRKISAKEKNIFLTKVASAGFDGNIQNISFEDLIAAITKINNGDLSFLETKEENTSTYTASSASGNYGSSGSSSGSSGTSSAGASIDDLSDDEISNIQTLSTLTKTWAIPKVVHQTSSSLLKTGQVSSDIYKQDTANIASLSELGEIDYEIESSQSDISNYTAQYQASKLRVSQANTYNSVNEAAYNEICGILAESNEQFKTTNEQITSLNTTITEAETALSVQCSAKDTLTISLSSVNCAIWDLNSQLANSEEGTNTSEIKNKLSSLKAERAEISKQLEQLSEEILANKTLLDTAYDNLDVALENLKTIDINNSKLSDNQKAQYQAIIENKQIIVQQNKLMTSAQAAITALDGYIQALYTRKEELLIEQKEEEAKNAKDNDEELSLKEKAQLANSVVSNEGGIKDQKNATAKLLDGVNDGVGMMTPNISEDTSEADEVSDETTKIYAIDGKKVKISYSKTDGDNSYKCCVEVLDENDNSLYNTDNHKFIFTTDNLSYEYALTKAQGESNSYNLEITNGYDDWNGSTLTIKDKDGTIISQREIKEIKDNENGTLNYVSVVELDKDLNELSNSRIQTTLDEDNNVIITIQEGKIDENGNYVSLSAIRNTKDAQGFETKKELISYVKQETDDTVGIVEQIISTELFEYEDGKISSKKSYNGTVDDIINKSVEYNYSDGTEVSQISYDTQGTIQSKITTKYNENEKLSSIATTSIGVSIADNIEYNVETKHTINYDADGKIVSQIVSTFGKDKDGNTVEEIKQYDSSGTLISDKYIQTTNQISTIIEQTEEKTVISMEYDDVKIQLDYDGTVITGSNYSEILTGVKTAIDAGGNNIDEINITSPIELKFKLENDIWIVSN